MFLNATNSSQNGQYFSNMKKIKSYHFSLKKSFHPIISIIIFFYKFIVNKLIKKLKKYNFLNNKEFFSLLHDSTKHLKINFKKLIFCSNILLFYEEQNYFISMYNFKFRIFFDKNKHVSGYF